MLIVFNAKDVIMSKESKNQKRRRKVSKRASKPSNKVYAAMHNKSHMTTVATANGSRVPKVAWDFITMLDKEIGHCLRDGELDEVNLYHMPAVERCLSMVAMINGIDKNEVLLYVSKKFKNLTMERLTTNHQTEEASEFKQTFDETINPAFAPATEKDIVRDESLIRTESLRRKMIDKIPALADGLFVPSTIAMLVMKQTLDGFKQAYAQSKQENLVLAIDSIESVLNMYEGIDALTSVIFIGIDDEADREKFMQIGIDNNLQLVVQDDFTFSVIEKSYEQVMETV
jgi:hypothetical protein